MVERKLFLQIQSINIVHHIIENMIAMPITNKMEIVMGIRVYLISWMKLIMRTMVERKLFFQIQSINIAYPNVENMIVGPITKRIEIVMSIQVCLFSRMNFDYEENGGKNALLANPKHQYRVSQCEKHDCNADNKKNGDCYWYPSFCHCMAEL